MLYVVMERGDTDLASLFRQYSKSGGISPIMRPFYWSEMLHAVQVLHKEGNFITVKTALVLCQKNLHLCYAKKKKKCPRSPENDQIVYKGLSQKLECV